MTHKRLHSQGWQPPAHAIRHRPGKTLAHTAALIILTIAAAGCRSADKTQHLDSDAPPAVETAAQSAPLPPLVIDMDAPLLLDDHAQPHLDEPVAEGADNSHCLVCHANYRREPLAARHAQAHMGCVVCHGDSFEHRNDENNTTPPEKMFARDAIDDACAKCHKRHDVPPRQIVARLKARGLTTDDPDAIVCTDCHGDHRLKIRTVNWNKKTGELL